MKNKKYILLIPLFLIFVSLFLFSADYFVKADNSFVYNEWGDILTESGYDIVVVFSNEIDHYPTEMKFHYILNKLRDVPNLNFNFDFYDSQKENVDGYQESKLEYIEKEFRKTPPYDEVILIDDGVMRFASTIPYEAKVFYAGVVNEELADLFFDSVDISGFGEYLGFLETARTAKKLMPKAKDLYVVFDGSDESKFLMQQLSEKAADYLQLGLTVHFLSSLDYSFGNVVEILSSFRDDEIVIYHSFSNKVNDRVLNETNIRNVFSEASAVPVFSVATPSNGLAGGFVVDEEVQAQMVVDVILAYLFDDNFDESLESYVQEQNKYVFDEQVIQKYNLSVDALPFGRELINRSEGEFSSIGSLFLGGVGVVLAALILLFISFQRQRVNSYNRLVAIENLSLNAKKIFENNEDLDSFSEFVDLLRDQLSFLSSYYLTYDLVSNSFEILKESNSGVIDIEQFFKSNRFVSNPDFLRNLDQMKTFVIQNPNTINYSVSSLEDQSVLVQAVMFVPIEVKNDVVHMLMFLSKDRNFYVSLEQMRAFDVMANSISSTLTNKRSSLKQDEMERSISLKSKELNYILMNSSNVIFIFDYVKQTIEMNDKMKDVLGIDRNLDDLKSLAYEDFIHPDDLKYNKQIFQYSKSSESLENNQLTLRLRIKTARFGYRWYQWHVFLFMENGENMRRISLGEDITEQMEREMQMTYLMTHDSLTELHNSTYIKEQLVGIKKDEHAFCAFINVDDFRLVNESYGHNTGDEFLIQFGRRLKFSLSSFSNVTVARVSGDEFAILVIEKENFFDEVVESVKKILSDINLAPIDCFGELISFNLSVGHASYPDLADDPIDIFRFAEMAMFESKEHNQHMLQVFDQKVFEKQMLVREITREAQRALLRDEFVMFYQPLFDVKHPNKVYFESLLRWDHPNKGLLSPNYFLDVVEKSGQIVDISRAMFRKICKYFSVSKKNGFTINSISFNISLNTLRQRDEALFFIDTMKEFEIKPSEIVLEITESLFFETNSDIYANLDRFREIGISIAIDDFGMKYSTLSVLEKVKYDMIKLDRHFTLNLGTKNADLIVDMVNELCKYNGKRCVVEGVEDEEQLETLKKRGFTEFQGYYFSKPLREKDVEKFYSDFFNY